MFDYNIDNDSMTPNYIFDFANTPGWGPASSAGGAWGLNKSATVSCNIYPNPTNDLLTVESGTTMSHCEVYNTAGAMLLNKPVDGKSFTINVSELPAGVYFIKTTSDSIIQTRRFIKK